MTLRNPDRGIVERELAAMGIKIHCPKCDSKNVYWMKRRKGWSCRKCGHDFNANFQPLAPYQPREGRSKPTNRRLRA